MPKPETETDPDFGGAVANPKPTLPVIKPDPYDSVSHPVPPPLPPVMKKEEPALEWTANSGDPPAVPYWTLQKLNAAVNTP